MSMAETVRTGKQLVDAIANGAQDIEIVEHLDFSVRELTQNVVSLSQDTRRIRGVCPSQPTSSLAAKVSVAAPSLQRGPGACIIYVEASFLSIQADTTWLDGLVIVNGRVQNRQKISTMLVLETGSLFLTNSQLIGSYSNRHKLQPLMRAVDIKAKATKAYCENVTVANVTASVTPVTVSAPTAFSRCSLAGRPVPDRAIGIVGRTGVSSSALLVMGTDALLTDTTVTAAMSDTEVVVIAPGVMYADAPVQIESGQSDAITAAAAESAPTSLLNMAEDESFRVLQQVAWGESVASAQTATSGGGGGLSTAAMAGVVVAAVLAVAAVVCVTVLALWRRRHRRHAPAAYDMLELGRTSLGGSAHKQTQRSPGAPPGGMHPSPRAPESPSFDGSGGSSPVAVSPSTRHSPRHFVVRQSVQLALHTEEVATYPSNTAVGTADSLQPHGQVATASSLQQAPAQQRLGVAVHRGGAPGGDAPPPQKQINAEVSRQMVELAGRILPVHPSEGPVAGRDEKVTDVQRVCNELQRLPEDCVTGLHGYVCNWAVRRGLKCGGQGVVVFVPQTVRRDPLAEARAMKIFAQPEPFAEEIRVYTNQDINGFMPYIFEYGFKAERKQIAAESMGEAVLQEEVQLLSLGAEYAVLGRPYIVMEKGQSLADCVQQHSQENRVQMLLTLLEVTRCLRKLHAAGYVHRDIKPDNLLRVKRGGHSEWKLIDCGLAAPVGTVVKPACTPQFAPPEVLNARAKRVTITADPALDSWSLGVTAFRLICPQAARNFFTLDHDEVIRRVREQDRLPWWTTNWEDEVAQRLMPLLQDLFAPDPSERLSVKDFLDKLEPKVLPGQH